MLTTTPSRHHYKSEQIITNCVTKYRGSPTSTVSTGTNSTSTNFSGIGIKFVLVELLCSKIRTSGNCLCSTHQYEFPIVRFFPGPKNRTKRGPPVKGPISPILHTAFFYILLWLRMQWNNCKPEIQWFTVPSTLLHCTL